MTYHRASVRACALTIVSLAAAFTALGQTASYPYVLKTFAGSNPLGDGGPAARALLSGPSAVVLDGLGNTFILDANNFRIREISVSGNISTVVSTGAVANDMKMGKDGSFYLTANALVFKLSPAGVVTVIAGTGTPGSSLDGIPATTAAIGLTGGIALDAAGDVYFVDGNRVREVTADGIIHTVAGTASGYLYNGDSRVATTANLYAPWGIALDSANNLYIADQYNSRVRKVAGGMISTVAGNGSFGMPAPGSALLAPQGAPYGLTLDSAGSVYITDSYFNLALKISTAGTITQLAGDAVFGYSDGPSNASYLIQPAGLAVDINGNVFIAEQGGNRVREVTNGNLSTFAGRLHYAGDGAAATSALLDQPLDVSLDASGDVFIADSGNFRIREVTPNGLIGEFAGSGLPAQQAVPGTGVAAQLLPMVAMAMDGKGDLFLAALSNVLKISSTGAVTNFAGTGDYDDTGDGGPATKATFEFITGVAVDGSGNVYVADTDANRVRKISVVDGSIAAFAGNGKTGYSGDGGLATGGTLSLSGITPLAADQKGNIYIGDGGNNVIRIVAPNGILGTAVGNGSLGAPADGAAAKSSAFPPAAGLAVDSAGSLFVTTHLFPAVYKVDSAGAIHLISGAGAAPPMDGAPANSTAGFGGAGLRVDANDDLYVTDPADGLVWKLVVNSPTSLAVFAGNGQQAAAGSAAAQSLQVVLNGRAAGVPGATINFAVLSGLATLSAATTQTDARGVAGVGVTLGSGFGSAVITAALAGSTLPPVQFTVTTADSLTLNPQSLSFSYNLGDPAPAPQTLTVGSLSGGALAFATGIGVTGDTIWMQVDTANGSTPANVQVSLANLDSLIAGAYSGSITVTSLTALPATQSVPVVLTVVDPNAVSPAGIRTRAPKRR